MSHTSIQGCWDTVALFWLAELVAPWLPNEADLGLAYKGLDISRLRIFGLRQLYSQEGALITFHSFADESHMGRALYRPLKDM